LAAPPPPWTASRSAPPAAVSSPLPTAASSSHAVLPYKKTKNNGGHDWATITIIIVQSYVWTIDPRVHSGGPFLAHPCIPVGKKVGPKGPVGLRKGGVRGGKKKKKEEERGKEERGEAYTVFIALHTFPPTVSCQSLAQAVLLRCCSSTVRGAVSSPTPVGAAAAPFAASSPPTPAVAEADTCGKVPQQPRG